MANSIPYALSIPSLPTRDAMSATQFNDMLEESLNQAKARQGMSLDDAFDKINEAI